MYLSAEKARIDAHDINNYAKGIQPKDRYQIIGAVSISMNNLPEYMIIDHKLPKCLVQTAHNQTDRGRDLANFVNHDLNLCEKLL